MIRNERISGAVWRWWYFFKRGHRHHRAAGSQRRTDDNYTCVFVRRRSESIVCVRSSCQHADHLRQLRASGTWRPELRIMDEFMLTRLP